MLRHLVLPENAHKICLSPKLCGEYGKVQGLSAGVHDPCVKVYITDVVPKPQNLWHKNTP